MATMKAFGIRRYGAADELVEAELPRPKLTLPHDILVNVKAVSVNPVDYKVREGGFGGQPFEGVKVIGWDAAGVVVEVGSAVTRFKPGDEVFYAGDLGRVGSNAEYHLVDARIVGRKPKTLSFGLAAAVPLVALTAFEGLFETARVPVRKSGPVKTLLVIGAAGGVGSLVVALAKLLTNLVVIGTASRPESVDYVKNHLHADHVISHAEPLAPQLAKIGIPKVDIVYNTSTVEEYFDQIATLVNPFGRIVLIVYPIKPLNLGPLYAIRAEVLFELMFTRPTTGIEPELQGKHLDHLADLIDAGAMQRPKTSVLPFTVENLCEAHRLIQSGKTIGKYTLEFVTK